MLGMEICRNHELRLRVTGVFRAMIRLRNFTRHELPEALMTLEAWRRLDRDDLVVRQRQCTQSSAGTKGTSDWGRGRAALSGSPAVSPLP